MGSLEQLFRGLVDQLTVDGLGVLRRFSSQLLVYLALVIPTLIALLLYRRRRLRLGEVDRLVPPHLALNAALLCALTGVLLITLTASPASSGSSVDLIPLHPLWTAITGEIDATRVAAAFGANIVLFIPLGMLLPLRWPRLDAAGGVLLVAGLLSVAIETVQYFLDFGRVAQLDDVIFNTLGALIGWALVRGFRIVMRWVRPATPDPRRSS